MWVFFFRCFFGGLCNFIIQYYKTLAENPAALHKFYSGHSVFKHSLVEGAPTVSGEDINAQITELYGDKHVDIVLENGEVDCQQGKDGPWAAFCSCLFLYMTVVGVGGGVCRRVKAGARPVVGK